jgi:hypothetical protein
VLEEAEEVEEEEIVVDIWGLLLDCSFGSKSTASLLVTAGNRLFSLFSTCVACCGYGLCVVMRCELC